MGVTRGENDVLFFYGYIEDEYQYELSLAEIDDEDPVCVNENKRKRQKKRSKHSNLARPDDNSTCRRMSSRQLKNYDRLKQLMNLIEKEEITDLDYDLFQPTFSAFAELFTETEKMKIWNDFINQSEEEQDKMLSGCPASVSKHGSQEDNEKLVREIHNNQDDLDESWEFVNDNRKVHPAYTAAACFKRINGNLRAILKKRNLPKETLRQLEHEVTSFFQEWPTSVYVSQLLTRFERLLIHAICQYLDLSSHKLAQSKGSSNEERSHTQILNKHPYFYLPPTKLVDYITQHNH